MHACGLAHLDLKLDNVKVRMAKDGSDLHLTILDLGSAQPNSIRKLYFWLVHVQSPQEAEIICVCSRSHAAYPHLSSADCTVSCEEQQTCC